MRQSSLRLPEKILAPYRGKETAVVTMFLGDGDMTFTASGTFDQNEICAPEHAIFEIGSITKVFTALLLAVLVEEGRIDPNRPIRDFVKELSDVPQWITPRALASHTSGLPRTHVPVWKALISSLPDDPYGSFSRRDLVDWFRARKVTTPPRRVRHAYSNLGYGLLGEAMAISEGRPYLDLLTEKVIRPLGLVDTTSDLTQSQQARLMQPYTSKGKPVVPWTFQAIAGAGCLRSTARDLGRFSSAVVQALANPRTLLDRAICRSVSPLVGLGPRGAYEPVAQCLGWLSLKLGPKAPRMLFHNGGTAGSTSALYICPEAMSGVLVLSNRGVAVGIWSSLKLSWSNPNSAINDLFASLDGNGHSPPHV